MKAVDIPTPGTKERDLRLKMQDAVHIWQCQAERVPSVGFYFPCQACGMVIPGAGLEPREEEEGGREGRGAARKAKRRQVR